LYKSPSSMLCNCIHYPLNLFVFGPNIFLVSLLSRCRDEQEILFTLTVLFFLTENLKLPLQISGNMFTWMQCTNGLPFADIVFRQPFGRTLLSTGLYVSHGRPLMTSYIDGWPVTRCTQCLTDAVLF